MFTITAPICSRLQGNADQINSNDDQHWAIKANDSNYSSFSWTRDSINAWWRIQLNGGPKSVRKIEIHNRPRKTDGTQQYNDLAKIYILTSNAALVKNNAAHRPLPTSEYWTIQSYQEEPYGPVGIIQLNPPVSATWVAVFSENNARLALAQVEVYNSSLQLPSLNLILASTDVDSVTITWALVTAQTVAHYEYKCTDKDWIVHNVDGELPVTVSGYAEETDVVCTVIAVVNSGESQQESAAITTGGGAKPVNIARQGTADQLNSLPGNKAYYAASGNNGNYDDFSHTNSNYGSWWRVDLHREFFIGRIELFNRKGGNSEGPYYDRLKEISVLTSTTNSVPPCRNCLQWTGQSNQAEPYGPVGIIQFSSQIYARYLAVYRSTPNSSLALAEVEIYVSASVDELITLTLSPCGSTCIDLEWTALQGTNGNILRYEYKCGGSNWASISSDATFARACGVTLSTQVTCTVMAVVEGDASHEVNNTTQTGSTGSCNIAYKKYTHQLDNFDDANRFPASLAVNGIIDDASDFTHTLGSNSGDKWWRLDLGISYQIGRIELYNRLGDPGEAAKYYYRLVKISVLTSDAYSPGPPSLSATTWTRRDGPNSKAYGPVRIIEFSSQISARHVAVYSESTEPLSLTEVTVYESNSLTKPLNSQLTNTSFDCMEFTWNQPHLTAAESIARYEWNCTDKEWIIVTGNNQSFTRSSCNYQPYTNVTCIVAVLISNGTSQMETRSAYTGCANPDPPVVAAISDLVKEKSEELDRETWKYTIEWDPPSRVNCDGTISYIYNNNNTETTEETDNTTYTVHLDGGQLYNFTIWSRNSHGQSTPVVKVWRADELAPQFEETDIHIATNLSQCIQLRVKGPKYPGGNITTFQSKCSDEITWTDLDLYEETTRSLCLYSPYTAVSCVVKAENGAGVTTAVRNISTLCADPELIGKIGLFQDYISESNTRTINVNMTQNITTNCEEDIITLEASINEGEFTSELTFPSLAANTDYTIKLRFTNSDNMSTEESIVERTGDLAPGTAPVLTGNATNSSCVHVTWSEPILSNGYILEYKYNCQNYTSPGNFTEGLTGWNKTDPLQKSLTECGFNFGDTVYCGITSFTSVGHGPTLILSTQVLCTNPSIPEFDVKSYLNNNQSVVIEILLQASEHHCHSLVEYRILIREVVDSKTIINNSTATHGNLTYSGFEPYTNYSVKVVAVNDDEKNSTNGTIILSAEKKPDTAPSITSLESNTSCVEIKAVKPSEPNGLIREYQFNCTSLSTENSTTADAAADESGSVEMCGFSPVTNVTCSVAALNKAGISPLVVESKYTQIKVDSTAPAQKH
ncbi:DSCAM [Bugula neritina]|uniref:DSCAM n=1 Tax=Bugula neritina TaxID=10212 RepID=A0A7J7JDW9_BUGNE|nr:DSCAM [Bugula neritina]